MADAALRIANSVPPRRGSRLQLTRLQESPLEHRSTPPLQTVNAQKFSPIERSRARGQGLGAIKST